MLRDFTVIDVTYRHFVEEASHFGKTAVFVRLPLKFPLYEKPYPNLVNRHKLHDFLYLAASEANINLRLH